MRLVKPLTIAAIAATVSVGVACGGAHVDHDRTIDVGGDKVVIATLTGAATALCDAHGQAVAGDFAKARATFLDRSHEPIHTIARALEAVDRSTEARLLEAKQRVEADVEGLVASSAGLADDLATLAQTAHSGLDRLGIATPPCAP